MEEVEVKPLEKEQLDELDKKENQFPDEQPSRIFTDSVKITCEGKLKALFLKPKDNLTPIPESHYKPALNVFDGAWMKEFEINNDGKLISQTGRNQVFVKKLYWRPSELNGRPMVKQRRVGGDLTMGFLPPRQSREDYFRANNRDQLFFQPPLSPVVSDLEAAMRAHLPDYYEFHMYQASKLVRPPDEVLVKNPWKVGDPFQREQLAKLEKHGFAHVPGSKAFSTLTLNKNILFGMHEDGHNMPHTLGCLTALGDFVGGYLWFPRLGVGFDVQPYDVLICDTNYEYHCSGPVVVGKRYTIVAYLHSRLDRGWRMRLDKNGRVLGLKQDKSLVGSIESWMKEKSHVYSPVPLAEWEAQNKLQSISKPKKESLPFEYTPNFLTKEEANELAAYFDTLTFDVRTMRWGNKVKRQSLGYIARNAFNDRKNWGTEYTDIDNAPEIIQRFRRKLAAHTGQEINYISILKYPSAEATINWHNHREDHWHNSPVWDVTIGPTERKFWAREVANPKETVTSVLAEVGSLVTLPASMNTTHEHAILRDKTTGVRYSINCKSLPLYGVWDCHDGKNYPKKGVNFHEDAVYVGCRVVRGGRVIKEGTIFGNATNPLVCHDGAFKTEAEFREYAERKMQDPSFRAKVRELKDKHLLCWCVQSGPKRAEFCHARVWLELANRD